MKTLIALTALNLLISGTTLTIVLVGAKKAQDQIEETRAKANRSLAKLKGAIDSIEAL